MNLLSQQLRKKRLEKGLQQKDMAIGLKMSAAAYSKIESGKTNISLELTKKIADFLQISINELIEGKSNNIEIKNVTNSAVNNENATIHLQNDKLIESQLKLAEQIISLMQNQNELFKDMSRIMKRL